MNRFKILWNGIVKENPALVLVLGMCPTLAVTNTATNALGMGIAATFVLICSNFVISLLKNVIPQKTRIPSFIVIIAGFVTVVDMLINAYVPAIHDSLGIFIPLIVVNCIILARAEQFASKKSVLDSLFDGFGMGLGFTAALLVIAVVRELLGAGTLFGFEITSQLFTPIGIFAIPAGGFITYGLIMALMNFVTGKSAEKRKSEATTNPCAGCPSEALCGKDGE